VFHTSSLAPLAIHATKPREGKIALQVVVGRDRETLHEFIKEHISDDAEAIFTDEWAAYRGIGNG
jgi:hypothetical protein